MALVGPRDTKTSVIMTGWDATELQNLQLRDGTTFAQIASMLSGALGGLTNELYNDPIWSRLVSYTDSPIVNYSVGNSNGVSAFTEYAVPDPQRAQREGHMLPLRKWDRSLEWTWSYMRDATMDDIVEDIRDVVKDWRDKWRTQILTRLLQRGDDSGTLKGLGSSGYSPGFATTAASTSVDFTPPSYGGTSFASTHEHYVGIAGGVFTAAVFSDAYDELEEHGHAGEFEFLIGPSDAATVAALTGFVPAAQFNVNYGALQDLAQGSGMQLMNGAKLLGAINNFNVWVLRGIPQYYGFAWKSYGANSQRNPLRIRVREGYPRRPVLEVHPDPRAGNSAAQPLNYLMTYSEFGVGVADRTNGTPRYVNNATWADGTAT